MDRYSNRATSLVGLAELADVVGADPISAMKSAGLEPSLLRRPEERVPFDKLCALFEHCATAWGLPDFGLRLARYQHMDILGPVALVTKMEPDLRRAINAIAHNLVVQTTATIAAVHETGDLAMVALDARPTDAGTRQYLLLSLGVAWNVLNQAGNTEVKLIEVSFRGDDNGARPGAEAHFRCPVRFNAEHNAIYFDSAVLDRPIERGDMAYHAIIRRYLATTRDENTGGLVETVTAEVARQMEFGVCTLESVAQKLQLEPRSLQRRLQREDISFKELVDGWRKTRALSLVTHTRLPLSEISLAIGYNDQSIFSRAFQRWYGEPPLAFRNRDAATGAAS